jgi:hypothetical protein
MSDHKIGGNPMKNSSIRPAWWFLYLSIALVLGLFWIEAKSPFSAAGHTWAEVGLVIILYGLVMTWLKANEAAIVSEEREKYKKMILPKAVKTAQTRCKDMAVQEGNSRPQDDDYPIKGRTVPIWLISLAAIVLAFFKTQDQ